MTDPRIYSVGENPENVYTSSSIPYEQFNRVLKDDGVAMIAKSQVEKADGFDDFIMHIRRERKRLGKADHSHETIKEHILKHSRKMGVDDAVASGFWGSLWGGIKHVASSVGNTALSALHSIASDPIKTISMVAPLLAL